MTASSVIGRGTVVRGNVRGEGNLEILGRVEGDVSANGDISLGEEAVVRGNVTGAELSVAGTVQGELRGSEAVLVERGARVVGDLSAPRIGIAPGALVRGNVRTDGEAPLAQPQRRPGAVAQPLRPVAAPAARPVASFKAEAPKPAVVERHEESEPAKREKLDGPPPPVVPAIAKGAKAKKKKREG